MSDYLVGELGTHENVTVRVRTRVVDAAGAGRLGRVTLEVAGSGARQTVPATALFVLTGGEPRTEWLAGVLERDAGGYIRTGHGLASLHLAAGPAAGGPPFPFESSLPGVFAAGRRTGGL